jgi:hypothetical protein
MTEALDRIARDSQEFRQNVDACRSSTSCRAVDLKAAHSALGRVRERFLHEKRELTLGQRSALQKVFKDD